MSKLGLLPPPIPRPEPTYVEDALIRSAMNSLTNHPQVNAVLEALWRKDPYSYGHSHRVADFSQWIGRAMGLSSQERVELYITGLLHDVGKIMSPDGVLKKPGPLTSDEFAIMRLHPVDSGKIVSTFSDLAYLVEPIRGHHERIDGRGYPDAKAGDQIHIFSRIILVADTFDAMTSTRVYRKQLDLARTYDELLRCSGTQFDPAAVQAFIATHQRIVAEQEQDQKIAA
ncbi:MAG: HD-GYP domain-containing protein [Bdellovibrionales bacterium]|nr:HD-GYP domain-containing protein [Bdellovibrionales bacterium]